MSKRKKYTLDFTNADQYSQVHRIICQGLGFPHYYGCNRDAFWDCLTEVTGSPICIEITGFDVLEQKFDRGANTMLKVLKDFKLYRSDVRVIIFRGDSGAEL